MTPDDTAKLLEEIGRLREALDAADYAAHQLKRAFEGGRVRDLDEAISNWQRTIALRGGGGG